MEFHYWIIGYDNVVTSRLLPFLVKEISEMKFVISSLNRVIVIQPTTKKKD